MSKKSIWKKSEEALRLKETHTLMEMRQMLGLTKYGAASRIWRARKMRRTGHCDHLSFFEISNKGVRIVKKA